jgi:hypothetical protein
MQHHEVVASLPEPEQDLWLERAERLRWSRNELRRQLRAHRDSAKKARRDPHPVVTLLLNVTPDRERRWVRAAGSVNRDLQEWIVEALDNAAESLLIVTENPPESVAKLA